MNVTDQGTREPGRERYHAIPRTLVLLTASDPDGERQVLLLKGAPHKRLWSGKYNGLGGHVEATEDIHSAAVREVWEEAGIEVHDLVLRGVVNIDTGYDEYGRRPGVLMFVFVGETTERVVWPTEEGTPEWLPDARLADFPLVDDLYGLIPRALEGPFFYGHYFPRPDGTLQYEFLQP
ncbi:MAG: NUDIX domain-containing protein [Caldilineaceae bacterium]|nr:NUDIX domain-containing protein [Caldilineaceae bacterium]